MLVSIFCDFGNVNTNYVDKNLGCATRMLIKILEAPLT